MAVHALFSAKGSPGVTTTLVALTRAWHRATGRRALGLDLDPSGGDVSAGVLLGSPPVGTGLLALATHRHDSAVRAVRDSAVEVADGSLLVPGVPDAARSGAIALAWDVVLAAMPELEESGFDVLVDGGRLVEASPAPVWMDEVDQAVMLVRPSLPWVAAAHRLATGWPSASELGVVVVEAPSPYSAKEVARAVARPLVDVLPFDPRAAAVHSDGTRPERHHHRRAYARAIEHLAVALTDRTRSTEPLGAASAAESAQAWPRGWGQST